MKEKDRLSEELGKHAPSLQPLLEQDKGLRVPADYFDQLEAGVFRQLDAIGAKPQPLPQRTPAHWWQVLQGLFQPRLALAFAGVVAIALAAWWYFSPSPAAEPALTIAAADISPDDAEAYLMDNLLELDPEQIAFALPGDELPFITIQTPETNNPGEQNAATHELQISPKDLDNLLKDMSDDELEELL